CSLSFYNAVQDKLVNRVQAVASVIDTRLVSTSFAQLSGQLDELMAPTDIVSIEIKQGRETVFRHQRTGVYHSAGIQMQYREQDIHWLKSPGMTLRLVCQEPMNNYLRSLMTTAPLTLAVAFIVLFLLLAVRWLRRQLNGQELLESRSARILN